MKKRIMLALLVVVCLFAFTGCFSFVDWTHNKRHLQAWDRKVKSLHKSFDRFFLDYDWDDTSLGIDEGY